jgi:Zn-dependent protease with chaperone function
MQISNARHTRVRTTAVMVAVVALLILPTVAHASHVGTVSITPAVGTVVADPLVLSWSRLREAMILSAPWST